MENKISPILCGVAGEYFVAGELSRRGYLASITLRNSEGVDIIVTDAEAKRSLAIQVKTSQGANRSWILNKKAEKKSEENLFYVFVCLRGMNGQPEYFIVPSKIVSEYVTSDHAAWLAAPPKRGLTRKDTSMRKFNDPKGEYLGRWDILGI